MRRSSPIDIGTSNRHHRSTIRQCRRHQTAVHNCRISTRSHTVWRHRTSHRCCRRRLDFPAVIAPARRLRDSRSRRARSLVAPDLAVAGHTAVTRRLRRRSAARALLSSRRRCGATAVGPAATAVPEARGPLACSQPLPRCSPRLAAQQEARGRRRRRRRLRRL